MYLTVNLIDRFLAVQPVVRKELQLVGVTALFLACKYEEVSVPVVQDLILISDKAYTGMEVLEMVIKISFCHSSPSLPYDFDRVRSAGEVDDQYLTVQTISAYAVYVYEAISQSCSV